VRKRSQRLWFIGAAALLAAGGLALAATALQDTVAFAYTPTQVEEDAVRPGRSVRIGGLVEAGSVGNAEGAAIRFAITDNANSVPVVFTGVLPDLFAEGQGVVAEGALDESGTLVAKRVLARHDETYMPKEAYEALKKQAEADGGGASSGGYGGATP
jgi:cytochrome c-type biogenesis protein CcmE